MRLPIVLSLPALLASAPLLAQAAGQPQSSAPTTVPKQPFVKADAAAAVSDLAAALDDYFVFPGPGHAYAAMLRSKLASGAYSNFEDAGAFAAAVTADLQAVHKDGHLRLQVIAPDEQNGARDLRGFSAASAVERAGWLADGVAYIDFKGFPGNKATLDDVSSFLAKHRDAKTLIIDERGNRGGGIAEMNLIFRQIFAKPTILLHMDTRSATERDHASPISEADSMRTISAPDSLARREHFVVPAADQGGLATATIYLLVANRTASAGEHFALALKRTHRATLIGETTKGAGNFGAMVPMGTGYAAFIPVGRTFDPDTGEGWEGTGVHPDIAVPADKALDEALRLAGINAKGDIALAALR